MKRILGIVGVVVLAWTAYARAQALPGNIMNTIFFQPGCATYVSPYGSFPPVGAMCIDTTTGGMYLSNGSAFVIGGSEIWSANAGAGQITATTTFFTPNGNSTNATTETIAMESPVGPQPVTVRNLYCQTSVAPGAGNTDAFTLRSGTGLVAVGSMVNSPLTCSITGASATSCLSPPALVAPLPAGSVIDLKDTTTGTPAARSISCTLQVDEL